MILMSNPDLIQKYTNYFISCCIQNAIPINIVSEKVEIFNEKCSKCNLLTEKLIQEFFMRSLPDLLYKIYSNKAMITGKLIEEICFKQYSATSVQFPLEF